MSARRAGRATVAADRGTAGDPTPKRAADAGSATVEFVFLAVLVLVPLMYLVLAAFELQRNAFAVTQAAREAGRAYATADDPAGADERARYAARLAVEDQGLDPALMTVRYAPGRTGCDGAADGDGGQSLDPGAAFTVCVTQQYRLPGVPGYLAGRDNTVTGAFAVRIDEFRSGP